MRNTDNSFEKAALVHIDAVYRAAYAMCANSEEADDLTQATFLKAFEKFGSFRAGTNCKAWLLRILRNKWIDEMRHRKIRGPVLQIEENQVAAQPYQSEPLYTNAEDMLGSFSDEQVIESLKSLPENQRLALFLMDIEQLTQEEAATVLGVPVGTVKSRTSRARANLKVKLLSHAKALGFTGGER